VNSAFVNIYVVYEYTLVYEHMVYLCLRVCTAHNNLYTNLNTVSA
jgi:hypothetical protein